MLICKAPESSSRMPQGIYFALSPISHIVVTGFCLGAALPIARRIAQFDSSFTIHPQSFNCAVMLFVIFEFDVLKDGIRFWKFFLALL